MWPIAKPATERRVAAIVVLVFVIAGCAWVLFSDLLLYSIVRDRSVVARLETAKGWAFVALAALLIYFVTRRMAARLAQTTRTISAVLESIGDGVLILGADRAIAYANPASRQMLRADVSDDLHGVGAQEFSRRFRVSYPDGRLVPPDQFVSQRVFDEPGPIRYTATLCPPGGAEVVVSCTAAGVRSEMKSAPDLVVSVMHDITASEHLDRLRDELFSSVAHAIKTPVSAIKSASEVASVATAEHLRRSTAIIERQCARIDRLVDNLLVLARIRSGTLQLHPADIDLSGMVKDVALEIERFSRGHTIRVHVTAHPRVQADPERLAIVLRNTMNSACRSSRDGSAIVVSLRRVAGDSAEIAISYQARPSHVDEDAEEPNFDDMAVSRYVTGMILQAHLGALAEESAEDATTLRIRLPAIREGD
ncbi:MAG TPA: PAS domain-containing sensor histidine kinase [Vicinamibacterales bacterium]|jgi:signal transduction histidine kinase